MRRYNGYTSATATATVTALFALAASGCAGGQAKEAAKPAPKHIYAQPCTRRVLASVILGTSEKKQILDAYSKKGQVPGSLTPLTHQTELEQILRIDLPPTTNTDNFAQDANVLEAAYLVIPHNAVSVIEESKTDMSLQPTDMRLTSLVLDGVGCAVAGRQPSMGHVGMA